MQAQEFFLTNPPQWLNSTAASFSNEMQKPMANQKVIKPITIGNVSLANNLILAPMAGVTDGSFRLLCSRLGAALTVSELASAKAITLKNKQTINLLRFQAQTRPFSAQIFGSDPKIMAEAAKIVEDLNICDIIDINMGCPVAKVVKTGAGSALMKSPRLAFEIVKEVCSAVKLPVTIKCRIGFTQQTINVKEFIKAVVDGGAKGVAVHARTKEAGYTGAAQWQYLEGIKDICKDVVFIANGDISSPEHLHKLYSTTMCDGFMIGRGCIGKPWVFLQLLGRSFAESSKLKQQIFRRHFLDTLIEHGPSAVGFFRVHLFNYLKSHPNASNLRRRLAVEKDPKVILKTALDFFAAMQSRAALRQL